MASSWRVRVCTAMAGTGLLGVSLFASAAEIPPRNGKSAQPLVEQALREGLDGRLENRSRLLRQALEAAPDLAAAHWQLGEVKVHQKWMAIEDAAAHSEQNPRLTRYRKQRAESPDTAAGQLDLANWCAKQGLADEERAHLTRVLVLEPEHPQVRARLGFRMVAGQWISKEDQDLETARAQKALEGLKKWEGKVQAIRKGFTAESLKARQTALERARAIDDPAAIAALEYVLAPAGEQPSMLAVDVIGKIKGLEAPRALARLAIISPWAVVRNSAAQQLKDRPRDTYVPAMLSTLCSPVQTRADLFQTPDGRFLYRHLFYREGQTQRQLAVLETEYRYAGGDADGAMAIALMNTDFTARAREGLAADQNRITAELNDRIFRTLSIATGESVTNDPEAWWKWWADISEVFPPAKESRQYFGRETIEVAGPTGGAEDETEDKPVVPAERQTPAIFKFAGTVGETHWGSCLAAGTLITTEQGPMAIEKIQLGDRVLSQNPETGELAFKPVLRTTVTRASRLCKVGFGYESFEATGGHLFWEPGKGWVKASLLKAGTRLHQPAGVAVIESAEEGRFDFTYNLVVADFHTYFVGKCQVLSHDITRHEATQALLPGLIDR